MIYKQLVLDPKLARKIMKDFSETQKTPSIMKNRFDRFTRNEKILLYSVCHIRASGNDKITEKLLVDLINMLCIMQKYKKGGSPHEEEQIVEYDPPKGSFLFNTKPIVLGGLGVAWCLIGLTNAAYQIKSNLEMFQGQIGTIGDLVKSAEKDWTAQSDRITGNFIKQFDQVVVHDPEMKDAVLYDNESDNKSDNKSDNMIVPNDLMTLPSDQIAVFDKLAAVTWDEQIPRVLIAEDTVMNAFVAAVAISVGDVLPSSFGLDMDLVLESTAQLQNELMSAFTNLTEVAQNSQPASLMRKFTKTQALLLTKPDTWKQAILSRDTSHTERAMAQLMDLQGQVITEYAKAAIDTFLNAKRLTKGKIGIMQTNLKAIINNLWAIKKHIIGLLFALNLIKSGIRTSDDISPDVLVGRKETTLGPSMMLGRSMRKKKPVTHKKPKGKKNDKKSKGKKSKGKRGKTKGKRGKTKGKRGKTRRK